MTIFTKIGQWIDSFMEAVYASTKEDSVASTDNSTLVVPVVAPVSPEIAPIASPDITFTPAGFKPKIVLWGQAVARWEGANPESNNPGNLKISTLTESWGATKGNPASDGGFLCHFSTYAEGFTALCNFLTLGAEGQLIISNPQPCTLQAFTERYAGNPPQSYINGISDIIGVSPGVLISTFLD